MTTLVWWLVKYRKYTICKVMNMTMTAVRTLFHDSCCSNPGRPHIATHIQLLTSRGWHFSSTTFLSRNFWYIHMKLSCSLKYLVSYPHSFQIFFWTGLFFVWLQPVRLLLQIVVVKPQCRKLWCGLSLIMFNAFLHWASTCESGMTSKEESWVY